MVDTVITFTAPATREQDAEGVYRDGEAVEREVYARMESVDRTEFFSGGKSGFRPELRFKVFHGEYHGEDELVWNGQHYAIYRTYRPDGSDELELYAQREAGVGNGTENGA